MRHYFCHVCAVYLSLQFSKKLFFRIRTLLSFSVYKIIITFAPSAIQNGQKIIFCCRIIINNVVLTHIFANRFAKLSQLLQKLLVALHYTLLLSHFLFSYISIHTALVAYLLRTRSNYHQYSSDRLHERILSLFTLSYYLFACVMCGIIYKKDIFDEAVD